LPTTIIGALKFKRRLCCNNNLRRQAANKINKPEKGFKKLSRKWP
jgi:hypothetical protein